MPRATTMHIDGRALRLTREAQRLSREALANKSKVTLRTLERLESQRGAGPAAVTVANVDRLARALGVPVAALVRSPWWHVEVDGVEEVDDDR